MCQTSVNMMPCCMKHTARPFWYYGIKAQCVQIHNIIKQNNTSNVFPHFFFFSISVFFHEHSRSTRQQGKGGSYLFNSFLPLPPALQTLTHQLGDYCRELTSAHRQQPDLSQEPLVSERKLLTTKLRTLIYTFPCSAKETRQEKEYWGWRQGWGV